jgi:hypothetical protein
MLVPPMYVLMYVHTGHLSAEAQGGEVHMDVIDRAAYR